MTSYPVSSGDRQRSQGGQEVQEFVKVVRAVGRDGALTDVLLEGFDHGRLQLGDSFCVAGTVSLCGNRKESRLS